LAIECNDAYTSLFITGL